MEIGSFPLEKRVCSNGKKNVEVPRRTTAYASFPFAREANAGAVLHPGRDIDRESALARHSSRTRAGRTGAFDHLPAALTARTGPLQREKTLSMTHSALSGAGGTGFWSRAGL